MWSALQDHVEEIPVGWGVFGLAIAVIAFEIVVLALARSRRRRQRAPLPVTLHAIAAGAVATLALAGWLEVEGGRALMVTVFAGLNPDPSMTATLLSRGLSTQMEVILLVGPATLLASLLWVAGVAYTLGAPRPDGRARSFPPAALVGAGLLPLAIATLLWDARVMRATAALAGVDSSMKRTVLEPVLAEARAQLTLGARTSTAAIVILAVVAVALIVTRGRRDGTGAPPFPRSAVPLALSAASLALAALLVFAARPAVAENELPWPAPTGSTMVDSGPRPTPDLIGPDAPEYAPVVEMYRDRLWLEGGAVDLEELAPRLGVLRDNFSFLHPGRAFNETVLIKADPATPTATLASALRALVAARYKSPIFVFIAKKTHVRPAFGRMEITVVTGARLEVSDADDHGRAAVDSENAVPLHLDEFADYGGFARRLVESRTAGKTAVVKLGRAPPRADRVE